MVLCCISQTNSGKHVTIGVLSGLLGALVIARNILPLILTDGQHKDEGTWALALFCCAVGLTMPILGSIASSAGEWTSECSCHCCSLGYFAIFGIPAGVFQGIYGIWLIVVGSSVIAK